MQYLNGVNTVWFDKVLKITKSQWWQQRRNNFGKKKALVKYQTQVTLRIKGRTQLSSSTKPHFVAQDTRDTPDMF